MPWATVFSATCAIISRMEPTDGALISAYQTGDEAAFATLVARHMRSVFNLALARPKFYTSVAAFSGCARTSTPAGQQYIKLVVDRGAGNIAENDSWKPGRMLAW